MRINGTRFDDGLLGVLDIADDLYGRRGDDEIVAGAGDTAYGGPGNDELGITGEYDANDIWHPALNATLIGGDGRDTLGGTGTLRGGFGDDLLSSHIAPDYSTGTQHGGRGADSFNVGAHADGVAGEIDILDFHSGRDTVSIYLTYGDGQTHPDPGWVESATIFAVLDTNGNGRLGDDIPLDGNSGVASDPNAHTVTIRLHEDLVVIHGADTLTAADWVT